MNLALFEKGERAEGATILRILLLKICDCLLYQRNVSQHLRFGEAFMGVIVRRMSLFLHCDKCVPEILNSLWESGQNFLLFTGFTGNAVAQGTIRLPPSVLAFCGPLPTH